jgi:hypothetical protein
MAEPRLPDPALLVIAVFSRYPEVLAWARARLEPMFGSVVLASTVYDFDQTTYYKPTMGTGLEKQFLVFHDLVAGERLPEIKLCTNRLEVELALTASYPEERPINLDPGMLVLGKFLLATTKDQAHRVYLRDGIYAEVTLRFQAGTFEPWPWTYADYRQPCVLSFLNEARSFYRRRLGDP